MIFSYRQSQTIKIPKQGKITVAGFISPDGIEYPLHPSQLHGEWVTEYYDWLRNNGYDLKLSEQDKKVMEPDDIRDTLVGLGWIRVRIEYGSIVITSRNPTTQFPLIEKFIKEIKDYKTMPTLIEDLEQNLYKDLIKKVNASLKLSKRDAET